MKVERIEESEHQVRCRFTKDSTEPSVINTGDIPAVSNVLKQVAGMQRSEILQMASLLDIFAVIKYRKEIESIEYVGSCVILHTKEDEDNG